MILLALAAAISGCVASDGDSLRCGPERIRLLAIDAPEMSRCPPQRRCAPGDPIASRDNLRRITTNAKLTIERVGKDRYGRTLAVVYAGGVNLSCSQLQGRHAIYRRDWDNGGRIARACPSLSR